VARYRYKVLRVVIHQERLILNIFEVCDEFFFLTSTPFSGLHHTSRLVDLPLHSAVFRRYSNYMYRALVYLPTRSTNWIVIRREGELSSQHST
jgi:hypothetical protein